MERFSSSNGQRSPFGSTLQRDIYRAFLDELQAITDYARGAMVLARHLPAVARLFDEIARVEMSHYQQLGQLLLHLGAEPTLNARLRQKPLFIDLNASTHAASVAHRMLQEKIDEEHAAAAEYERLATLTEGKAAEMLREIAAEEAGHEVVLRGMLARFERG